MARVAMIGATGLVGRALAPQLVGAGHDVLLLSRRPAGIAGAREIVAPLEDWPAAMTGEPVEVAISTLGTTWRQAGSWERFEAVDRRAVTDFARTARAAGAWQMICVSSSGADPASRNNYLALKGRAEVDLAALGFERLDIVRPGLLRGERGPDRRLGERIGIAVSPFVDLFLRGPLDRFSSIPAKQVATAIASLAGRLGNGRFVHDNRAINKLA